MSSILGVGLQVASAQLGAVGPVNPATGYPQWYIDSNGLSLDLCLNATDPMCGFVPGDVPNAAAPLSIPTNFPEESFYFLATALMPTNGDGRALLVLGLEAALANGAPAAGDQVVFARYRVRVDNLEPGATYRVTHPYGVDTFTVDPLELSGPRNINFTEDIGIVPGIFTGALAGRIGPFLRWDPASLPAAPAGYLGDPAVEHRVTGSPVGTNIFRIEGPNVGGPGVNLIQTDLFTVQGKITAPVAPAPAPALVVVPAPAPEPAIAPAPAPELPRVRPARPALPIRPTRPARPFGFGLGFGR